MLYTVELDTAPGLVEFMGFDVSAFAEALEQLGAQDAVSSVGAEGSLGFTAQFEAEDIIEATKLAIKTGGTAFDAYFPIESVRAYLTPVLEDAAAA